MNRFDLALLGLLILFTFIGVWRGFVREVISLITWIAASVAAWMFADRVAGVFSALAEDESIKKMLAFLVIFVCVFILGMIVSFVLHRFVSQAPGLRMVNRVTGGIVGLARGVVIAVVLFILASLTSFPEKTWWQESLFAPALERAAVYVAKYLPPDVARHVRYG